MNEENEEELEEIKLQKEVTLELKRFKKSLICIECRYVAKGISLKK